VSRFDFRKYHGLGNDYIVIDPNKNRLTLDKDTIVAICDRNKGVGSDGILYGPMVEGDQISLRIFNPDGSEAEKSGNGLRIFSRYLFDEKYIKDKKFRIQTLGGEVSVEILDETGSMIKIDMGKVTFQSSEIPVAGAKREVIDEPLEINGHNYKVTCLSIGNPHCVIPMNEISEKIARELGPYVENHKNFPNKINMQLLKVLDRKNIQIEIWERGAGYTLASGSSSCAAVSAVHKLGLIDDSVTVHMPGGELKIEIATDLQVFMTGPVESIFSGSYEADFKPKLHIQG